MFCHRIKSSGMGPESADHPEGVSDVHDADVLSARVARVKEDARDGLHPFASVDGRHARTSGHCLTRIGSGHSKGSPPLGLFTRNISVPFASHRIGFAPSCLTKQPSRA